MNKKRNRILKRKNEAFFDFRNRLKALIEQIKFKLLNPFKHLQHLLRMNFLQAKQKQKKFATIFLLEKQKFLDTDSEVVKLNFGSVLLT